jgi:hypothetical protein
MLAICHNFFIATSIIDYHVSLYSPLVLMFLSSSFACQFLAFLGLLDSRHCDTLSSPIKFQNNEEQAALDSVLWLKLVFVPVLGLLILLVFLLEDYCYQSKENGQSERQQEFDRSSPGISQPYPALANPNSNSPSLSSSASSLSFSSSKCRNKRSNNQS